MPGVLREVFPERQSEILRSAQDEGEGLRMTALNHFSAACETPPFRQLPKYRFIVVRNPR
jgi:hypothetical protein